MGHPGFIRLTELANTQLYLCRAQQLANIIWAFATLGHTPPESFMEALAEESLRKRAGFNPQNIANMLWAFVKLDYIPKCPLVKELAEEAGPKLTEFNSQNVSNMLWAFAKAGHNPGRELLDYAVQKIMDDMGSFNAQVHCYFFGNPAYTGPSLSVVSQKYGTHIHHCKTAVVSPIKNVRISL